MPERKKKEDKKRKHSHTHSFSAFIISLITQQLQQNEN